MDTLAIPDASGLCPEAVWQLEVPRGNYTVEVEYSDPYQPLETAQCLIEGVSVAAFPSTEVPAKTSAKKTVTVAVVDGYLTFSPVKRFGATTCRGISSLVVTSLAAPSSPRVLFAKTDEANATVRACEVVSFTSNGNEIVCTLVKNPSVLGVSFNLRVHTALRSSLLVRFGYAAPVVTKGADWGFFG
jgi:hypothetical protein